ncbi:MAG: exodeoxyribonuclease III [Legionellales bacterium]|nr:exodeoxyribonuclease III [Legionellales bacterium]
MLFKVASWNVNSIKVRLEQVLDWCAINTVDLISLQETKSTDENFPKEELRNFGYNTLCFGQKQYNGVAILSKNSLDEPEFGLFNESSEQRRYIACTVNDIRIINVYVPNGESLESEKYIYKLKWLDALNRKIQDSLRDYGKVLVMGDFNIAPTDQDVYDSQVWQDRVLVSDEERTAFQNILSLGLHDLFRYKNPDSDDYSWWNYRNFAYKRNHGLRIDHILCSNNLLDNCNTCFIDKNTREDERPSDHAVVGALFNL